MKKITRLDDDKSMLYDKFIKYLKDKGYSTPIPTTLDDDLKALGFDKDEELVEILDAMLERKIVEKRIHIRKIFCKEFFYIWTVFCKWNTNIVNKPLSQILNSKKIF